MKRIRIRVKGISGFLEGQVVTVAADERGTPLDAVWRRRMKAAELDGSCVVIQRPSRSTAIKETRKKVRREKPTAELNEPAEAPSAAEEN